MRLLTRMCLRMRMGLCSEACLIHNSFLFANAAHPEQLEFAAEHLHQALRDLGRITGRVDIEDILDILFRDFCIGK